MAKCVVMTLTSLALLAFGLVGPVQAQTVLKDCPCSYTYFPKKAYEGTGATAAAAQSNAWSSYATDVLVGFKPWFEGLKNAAPKCDETCTPASVSDPGPLTVNQTVEGIGTPPTSYKATLTFQTTMTVTCGKPLPQKVWF